MKKLVALLGVLVVLACLGAASASTVPCLLVKGSHGQRVKDLQWLLGGHKPSAYRISTFPWKPNGLLGKRTALAIVRMKYRLGYPDSALTPVAGNDLFNILEGKVKRPLEYIVRAGKRVPVPKPPAPNPIVQRIISIARSQVGVQEVPDGSNWGPMVSVYQSVTGAYHAAWCVSFAQWVMLHAGAGTFANRTAGVFYAESFEHNLGRVHALPVPGALVAFMEGEGHMGIVVRVYAGGFESIEGNAANGVRDRFHSMQDRQPVFIYLKGAGL